MNEYIQAVILGSAGGLAKGVLTYVIDKRLDWKHFFALLILGGVIALGLLPFSRWITEDPNMQDMIIFWGGLLAPNVISIIENKLPNLLALITKQKGV